MFASTYCSQDCKQTFIQESSLWRKVLSCFHGQRAVNRPEQGVILLKYCVFLCILAARSAWVDSRVIQLTLRVNTTLYLED